MEMLKSGNELLTVEMNHYVIDYWPKNIGIVQFNHSLHFDIDNSCDTNVI